MNRRNLIRPVLPAWRFFLPFLAFIAKPHPKPPFGNPRAFQPPKKNTVFLVNCLVRIDSALSSLPAVAVNVAVAVAVAVAIISDAALAFS